MCVSLYHRRKVQKPFLFFSSSSSAQAKSTGWMELHFSSPSSSAGFSRVRSGGTGRVIVSSSWSYSLEFLVRDLWIIRGGHCFSLYLLWSSLYAASVSPGRWFQIPSTHRNETRQESGNSLGLLDYIIAFRLAFVSIQQVRGVVARFPTGFSFNFYVLRPRSIDPV